ncbi:uncharacterized protein LOC133381127 isoform X3 [Rhineura floridana]|uniref:uncharacterized protein LOC133375375 isoform X3 n=1 Tax=Rhineura floridana TaxID=261503 RepID=UPI002AC88E8F|nr:uncharacterized protein LOC133375375 isoform X3 [Rhineura floridana]XP_061475704.1 uncharacterized protein LOC133381127 isoform X3 [Rhineura floridana]
MCMSTLFAQRERVPQTLAGVIGEHQVAYESLDFTVEVKAETLDQRRFHIFLRIAIRSMQPGPHRVGDQRRFHIFLRIAIRSMQPGPHRVGGQGGSPAVPYFTFQSRWPRWIHFQGYSMFYHAIRMFHCWWASYNLQTNLRFIGQGGSPAVPYFTFQSRWPRWIHFQGYSMFYHAIRMFHCWWASYNLQTNLRFIGQGGSPAVPYFTFQSRWPRWIHFQGYSMFYHAIRMFHCWWASYNLQTNLRFIGSSAPVQAEIRLEIN